MGNLEMSRPSNEGNFSINQSSSGRAQYYDKGSANGELEYRKVEKLSKSIRQNLIGFDLNCREQKAAANKKPNSQSKNYPDFLIDSYSFRPARNELFPPVSKEEFIDTAKNIIMEIDAIGLENLPEEWHVIRGNNVASVVYLEERDRLARGEEPTPYREYLLAASGIEPKLIPESELKSSTVKIADILQRMGEMKQGEEFSNEVIRSAVRKRSEMTRLSLGDFKNAFRRAEFRNRAKLSTILDYDFSKVEFDFEWEDDPGFWMFWEEIGQDKDRLRANSNSRHDSKRDIGYAGMYGGHEPSHFYEGHIVRREVRERRLDPAAGLLTIPGPACYQLEGIAQTVGDLAGFETNLDEKLAVELYRLERRALVNGLYMVENGHDLEETVRWMRKYTYKNVNEENRRLLTEGTTRPFERAYLPVYGRSDYDLMQVNEKLGDTSNLIPIWFSKPQMPYQMLPNPLRQLIKYAE